MLVVFRVDASFDIGTGHVMRCITLAKAMHERDFDVLFLCRNHAGNMVDYIAEQGLDVLVLGSDEIHKKSEHDNHLAHSAWLGVKESVDAEQSSDVIKQWLILKQASKVDLLVIDHYGLDRVWESGLKPLYNKCLVIDDLADREHDCDVLLDQSFMRESAAYSDKVPKQALLLLGSSYGLLRPEFLTKRAASLLYRANPSIKNIVISMGGVDKDNITRNIIEQLADIDGSRKYVITVILGASSPWLKDVTNCVSESGLNIKVLKNVKDVASLLSECDLAFGAAGASTWERCALGVPTIMFILASNQLFIAEQLSKKEAVLLVANQDNQFNLKALMTSLTPAKMKSLSSNASMISDGSGVERVIDHVTVLLS